MVFNNSTNINDLGHLTIGGCDTVELAKKYGTPLYVVDENAVRNVCKEYVKSFERHYNGNGQALYASKALSCKELCRIANSEGMGLDVVSGGELYTAMQVDFPAEKIHFHGNNKTIHEIEMGIDYNIGKFVTDNLNEIKLINKISKEKGKVTKISMRIKPGIDAHTHDFIMTGQIDSKFGFALENGEALDAVKKALEYKNVDLVQLHCHIGSQIFDIAPFVEAGKVMMDFIGLIKKETGHVITQLNLGGGFGIRYTDEDSPVAYDNYMEAVSKIIKEKACEYEIDVPYIYLEPGRSVVGEAGITLYTVGNVKEIKDVRTYVSIDGGMCDNIRFALYGSKYDVLVANKANEEPTQVVTIAGKCCESGDLIQKDTKIAQVEIGDTIAVLATGAYNYSMASNYNRLAKPAIVMVNNGESRVIVKRESYEDLTRNDI